MNLIERALETALTAHVGQMDDDGLPHIVHSIEVMTRTKALLEEKPVPGYHTEELLIAAILHDVVEDNKTFPLYAIKVAFGERIADIVDSVSRRDGESYRDFIYRAKAHPAGRVIKLADLLHNRSRASKISEKKASWRKKLEYKYAIATAVLNDSTEPTWEGASIEFRDDKYYVADPNGKEIELPKVQADNVKLSFTISN